MKHRIPFNKPFIVGEELYYMAQAMISGETSWNGEFSSRATKILGHLSDDAPVLLTNSCTSALEIAAHLCDLDPGDEVILPSFTFVSTANAFCLNGAVPRFVDIRSDTLNLDESQILESLTDRTKVIVPVHYAGIPCEMNAILEIAQQHGCIVVEDAAQAVGSLYRQQHAGAIGDLGAFSFHETKNFICGEGGALVVRDENLLARAEVMLEEGADRRRFTRGEVNRYQWREIGVSAALPELLAAFLLSQLEKIDEITCRRKRIHEIYNDKLSPLSKRGLVTLPSIPADCTSNYHLYRIMMDSERTRSNLIDFLDRHGINSVFHYVPLHTSPMGIRYGYAIGDLPVTERVSETLLRLPLYFEMTDKDVVEVADRILEYFGVCSDT